MAVSVVCAEDAQRVWPKKKAWEWYKQVAPIAGVNYVPSTAVNMLEWWQADTFDPKTIDRELKWAHDIGYNSIRCNLSFEVWEVDPKGFNKRLDKFLKIAAKHDIGVMLCLFDDVNFARAEPIVGKQPEPVPQVHNSRWVPSPNAKKVLNKNEWPALEKYVKDIVGEFAKDERVLIWDLYNEPGNGGLRDRSLPLVLATFKWAREMKPVQPLTTGPWCGHNSPMANAIVKVSDVVSFHDYGHAGSVDRWTKHYMQFGRPVLCTETIRRVEGKRFADLLPIFSKHQVGWYNWGLVAGKQQTYLPWGDKSKTINDPWHWDLLWPDGKPYDPKEIELIKAFKYDKQVEVPE
ncbi:hypothetical protein BVX94_03440 [bacterium B17]|nr:hypothetical protein BVX94_03440 [bacterium B17]